MGWVGWRRGRERGAGPVGAEPAGETVGVVASAEVVVAGFGVTFFAFELVVLRAGVGVGALAAKGIEVGVVAHDAGTCGDDARSAEEVFDVVIRLGERNKAVVEERYIGSKASAGPQLRVQGNMARTISAQLSCKSPSDSANLDWCSRVGLVRSI